MQNYVKKIVRLAAGGVGMYVYGKKGVQVGNNGSRFIVAARSS
jgi:hypothetical protein